MYMLLSVASFYVSTLTVFLSVFSQHCVVWCLQCGFRPEPTGSMAWCHLASPSSLAGWALSSPYWARVSASVTPQSPLPHPAPITTTSASTAPNKEVTTCQPVPLPITQRVPMSDMAQILNPKWMCSELYVYMERYTQAHIHVNIPICSHTPTVTWNL